MNKLKSFLQSNIYIISVFSLAFIAFISTGDFQIINRIAMSFLLIAFALILSFSKDTIYVVPITFALLYSYNTTNPNLDTLSGFNFVYLIVIFVIGGLITHIIRFKPKPKKGVLTISFALFILSYFIPMIYRPFTWTLLQLSSISIVYLLVYVLLGSTIKPNKDFLMKTLFAASVLLVLEMAYQIGIGYFETPSNLALFDRIKDGMRSSWYSADFGWGNVNDVTIHITLLFGSQIYMLIKYQKKIIFWLTPLFTVFVIFLMASRGGYLSIGLSLVIYGYLIYKNADKETWKNLLITLSVGALIALALLPAVREAIIIMAQGGFKDFNYFTSGRLGLYKNAIKLFKQYPLFGAGWESMTDVANPNRIQVFHSTIFHTLAVMGLLGMGILIYYFYVSFKFLFTNRTLHKTMIAVGILVSQLHGLYDNTQFMLIYTMATILLFTMLEPLENKDIL